MRPRFYFERYGVGERAIVNTLWRRGSHAREGLLAAGAPGLWFALVLALAGSSALKAQSPPTPGGLARIELGSFYEYQPVAVTPNALSAPLPLSLDQVSNAPVVDVLPPMDQSARQALERNGFVVLPDRQEVDMIGAYEQLAELHVPNFITSDSMLHLYHVQFDEILKTVEANEFFPQMKVMSEALFESATNQYGALTGDLQEAARRNVAFCSVALALLGEAIVAPAPVADIVAGELDKIERHAGFGQSPLFAYQEDYSQYVPRGHYTRSEELKEYFKTLMWYGRMAFLLKGGHVPDEALVSVAEARIQTLAAALLTLDLDRLQAGGQPIADIWNRVYAVTAFFVGLADDLTPYDYKVALGQVFGAQVNVLSLTDDASFLALRKALAAMPNPEIYGGTGNILLPPDATAADLDQVLAKTKGMRLMGQRFVPDSYMMQHLVFPAVGLYTGAGNPFTLVMSLGGPIRGFPRGLDVMVVLGSERALNILDREGDTDYADYDASMNALIRQFRAFSRQEWTRNLYWSWLYALQPLLERCGPGYPAFMQTAAWQDKQLGAALASWAELRHDTILYAKQSTTVGTSYVGPDTTDCGYVEPVPEFYNRLKALTRMTQTGLATFNVLDSTQASRLNLLGDVLDRLTTISVGELEGRGPSAADGEYINGFGHTLAPLGEGLSDTQAGQTALVADVHTDPNSGKVLEEGVGYVKLLVAAYQVPGGRTVLGAGPVFSSYEFKWPMDNRLTDENWTNLLASGSQPARPDWVASFMQPVTLFSDASAATNGLRLMLPQFGANGVRLQWPGEPTRRYRALYSEDLATWLLLKTPAVVEQGTAGILDSGAATAGRRFYKVNLVR
ncbi:MAG: DUF3160 domain-containing protein [Verrucomicrobiota bacterium]|jgi:hypothetical protein